MKPINLLPKRLAIVFLVCFASLGLTQCESVVNVLFPVEDDRELGAQMDQQIRSTPREYPLLNNAQVNTYLQNMANSILNAPQIRYRNTFAYKVECIRDDNTINAFCTPGGYIYVYTGLIKMLDNEAALAGVMGHEIAHAERRHAANRIAKAYGVSLVTSIALGQNPSQLSELVANLFGGLALLANSRSDESEADEDSFNYLRSVNIWYPGGVKFFFEKVAAQGSSSGIERLLSTHPLPQDRVDAVNKLIRDNNIGEPTAAQLRVTEYEAFKRTLP